MDPGSRVCGYGVIDVDARNNYCYVECGVLTAAGDAMEERLGEISRHLTDVVTELRPELIAVEDVFSRINPRTALALAQARGAVLAVAGMAGLRVYSYAPAVVKKMVTGRGRATKQQMTHMVQVLVGLKSPPRADAADALAVAITCAQRGAAL